MEKEEAYSLRTALEDMDLKDAQKVTQNDAPKDAPKKDEGSSGNEAETRLYNAALDEAAELVWQHQHGVKPPEPGTPYSYKPHLREKSYAYARTASIGRQGRDVAATGLARDGTRSRSVSGSSSGSDGRPSLESPRMSLEDRRQDSMDSTGSRTYGSLAQRVAPGGGRRRSSMKRNISGEVEKPFSGDQIWEEPEGDATNPTTKAAAPVDKPAAAADQPLRLRLRNPLNRVQFSPDTSPVEKDKETPAPAPAPTPAPANKPLQRVEIHRNPPSQSRNPLYTSNSSRPAGPRVNDSIKKKNGIEVRGDDIREATSFKLGDRSRKLPTPSAVSDTPGRPIVSFDNNWKPPEEAAADKSPERKKEPSRFSVGQEKSNAKFQPQPNTQAAPSPPVPSFSFTPAAQVPSSPTRPSSSTPSIPSIAVEAPSNGGSMPSIPMIAVTADETPAPPSITVSGDMGAPSIPMIVTPDDDNAGPSIPVIVTPGDGDAPGSGSKPSARPLPTPTRKNPFMRNSRAPQGHWSAAPGASARATAICHECSLPIEGRVISLRGGGERFHPQCFACYTCGTSLEALEISPEPDSFRSARLDRIARRAAGETLPEEPGQTMAEDGDARLRFFCHLDWHELFAPRCKTCTTPILGDHIVALGHHFHYGHFFCAECGDPFEKGMTHIEKDGYAWCVNCQTKRTERRAPKCKRCKLPVIGQYVQALGGEWHDECFRCGTCGGGFDDGQIFPVTDGIRCTECRMKELKA